MNVGRATYSSRRRRPVPTAAVTAVMFVLLAGLAFLVGRVLAPAPASTNPLGSIGGIPVGVQHSPAGALAAADPYAAVKHESVEEDPARERRLIAVDDAAAYQSTDVRSAASVRAQDPTGERFVARGGRALWVLAARRLGSYTAAEAQVTLWGGAVFWAGGRAHPGQSWGEDDVTLVWRRGRWRVTRDVTVSLDGPAAAVVPQATAANSSTSIFDEALAGFSSPPYGGGQ